MGRVSRIHAHFAGNTPSLLRKLSTAVSTGHCSGSQTPDKRPSGTQEGDAAKASGKEQSGQGAHPRATSGSPAPAPAGHPRGGRLARQPRLPPAPQAGGRAHGGNPVIPSLHLSNGETGPERGEWFGLDPRRLLMTGWGSNLCLPMLRPPSPTVQGV